MTGGAGSASGEWMRGANLESSKLAMHSVPSFDYSNIIDGCDLANGDEVKVVGSPIMGSDGRRYVQVYSPKTKKTGYVNTSFLE